MASDNAENLFEVATKVQFPRHEELDLFFVDIFVYISSGSVRSFRFVFCTKIFLALSGANVVPPYSPISSQSTTLRTNMTYLILCG